MTYLKLNLSLSNVLLATAAAGDLLCLRDLVLDSLGAEVLERVALNSVDAELRAGLNSGEAAGNCGRVALVVYPRVLHLQAQVSPGLWINGI
jgi:hypothetical protein